MFKTVTWFRIHSFTGVIAGLMLFVICWSGTFAVISHELDWLAQPAMRVEPRGTSATWGEIQAAAQAAVPNAEVTYMEAPLHRRASAKVHMELPDGGYQLLPVDPYTAKVREGLSEYTLVRFFRNVHYNLFDVGGFGFYLVTIFSLVIFVSLVSALCFLKRWWTRFFDLPRGKERAWWRSVHQSVGLWSLWFLAVIAVTGVWYLYEAAQHDLFEGPLNYVSEVPYGVKQVPLPETDPSLAKLSLDEVLAKAKQVWPQFQITTVAYGWYSSGEDVVYLQGRSGFSLVRGRASQMHLDPRTGEVLWRNSAGDLPPYWLLSNMADPLHFGNFGGLWSKAVWFIFGLALCVLILTGTYLHAKRLAKDARGRHRWPGTMAAIVVTLLVLAATVPAGFHQVREHYGPTVDGVKQLPTLAPGVKAFIVGWVALTLAIIGWWVWLYWRALNSKEL